MSKYKVGDKVRIRSDLHCGSYGGCCCVNEMVQHAGKVVTVKRVHDWIDNRFWLEEDLKDCDSVWQWSNEMVEPYVEEKKMFTKSDLRNGDVILRNNGEVEIAIVDLGVFISKTGWMGFDSLNEDLTETDGDSLWNIKAVRRPNKEYGCQFCAFENKWGDLVYDRERDTKKLYNGKVVCIDLDGCNHRIYTVGKIYQFKDGILCGDNGLNYPCEPYDKDSMKIHSFEEWADWTGSKFIEVVE